MAKDEKPADDSRARLGTALERLATGRFVITVEQTQASQARAYRRMLDKGLVDAVTLPDLPLVGRFRDLLARRKPAARAARASRWSGASPGRSSKSPEPVFTVSASLRTAGMVARRVVRGTRRRRRWRCWCCREAAWCAACSES